MGDRMPGGLNQFTGDFWAMFSEPFKGAKARRDNIERVSLDRNGNCLGLLRALETGRHGLRGTASLLSRLFVVIVQ